MLMKVFERYFSRNPVSRQLSFEADTAVIVIIPVFNDPDIFATLDSLCCCSVMNIKAGVLIVVNHSEVCPQEIKTRNIGLSDTLKRYVRDRRPTGFASKWSKHSIYLQNMPEWDWPGK